jgi:hypothetical protein
MDVCLYKEIRYKKSLGNNAAKAACATLCLSIGGIPGGVGTVED